MSGDNQNNLVEAIRDNLEFIRGKRGFVMPHHVMWAALSPDLLQAYEAVYHVVNFKRGALAPLDRNFVWLVVVACAEVPVGGHHLKDFLKLGGTNAQVEAAAILATLAAGMKSLSGLGDSWKSILSDLDIDGAYYRTARTVGEKAGMSSGVVEVSLVAGQACRRAWDKVGVHIVRAKAEKVADEAIAEALSLAMLVSGTPIIQQASAVWKKLIEDGKIEASPAFRESMSIAQSM